MRRGEYKRILNDEDKMKLQVKSVDTFLLDNSYLVYK